MLNLLYTELFKLKSSKMLWLIVIGALFSNLFSWWGAFYSLGLTEPMPIEAVMYNIELMMNMVVAPLVFYLFTGYIVAREYQEKTINNLFTYPYPRSYIVMAKLLMMLLVIIATGVLTYLFMFGGAWLYQSTAMSGELLWHHAQVYGLMIIVHFALIPIAFSVSYVGKSYLAPMIFALLLILISGSVLTSQSSYKYLFPWTALLYLNGYVGSEAEISISLIVCSLAVTFVVPLVWNLYYVAKSDVQSGS